MQLFFVLLLILVSGSACRDEPPPPRVVVLGMDGLDRRLLERMMEAGELPHFQRLVQEGLITDLRTTWPMLSPIIWTTVASGYPQEIHGIAGWTSGEGRPFTARDVSTRRLWDVASTHEIPVLVAGWLMSWPAGPIRGRLYTDKLVWAMPLNKDPLDPTVEMSRRTHAELPDLAFPPEVAQDALQRAPSADALGDHPLRAPVEAAGAPFHPWFRDETQIRLFEAFWAPVEGERPRLGMVYLVGADQVSHLYWPFTDRNVERMLRQDPEARMRAAEADRARRKGRRTHPLSDRPMTPPMLAEGAAQVPLYYRWLDDALGRVMARIDPKDTTLIVMSDHGFDVGRQSPVLSGGHRDPAVLLAWGGATRKGARAEEPPSVLDLAPTVAALLGLPAAGDWTGQPMSALFQLQPSKPGPSWRIEAPRSADPTRDEADRKLLRQLEVLGYVDEQGAPVPGEESRNIGRPAPVAPPPDGE